MRSGTAQNEIMPIMAHHVIKHDRPRLESTSVHIFTTRSVVSGHWRVTLPTTFTETFKRTRHRRPIDGKIFFFKERENERKKNRKGTMEGRKKERKKKTHIRFSIDLCPRL